MILATVWEALRVDVGIFVVIILCAQLLQWATKASAAKKKTTLRKRIPSCVEEKQDSHVSSDEEQQENQALVRKMQELVKAAHGEWDGPSARHCLEQCLQVRAALKKNGTTMGQCMRGSPISPSEFYFANLKHAIRAGRPRYVEDVMNEMDSQGIRRTFAFYEGAMKILASTNHQRFALKVYNRLEADGIEPSPTMYSCLVSFAADSDELDKAVEFFDKLMQVSKPTIRAYMTILRVHSKRQDWTSSISIFRDMQRGGIPIDSLVLNIVLATGVSSGNLNGVISLFEQADRAEKPYTDQVSYNTVMKAYAHRGDYCRAESMFQRMLQHGMKPDSITYNTIMDASLRSEQPLKAWDILEDMRKSGLKPDRYTCCILSKCLTATPSPERIQVMLDAIHEISASCPKSYKMLMWESIIAAAVRIDRQDIVDNAFKEMDGDGLQAQKLAKQLLKKVLHRKPRVS